MVQMAVAGASGRMGRLLVEQILISDDVRLAGALEHPRSPEIGTDVGALVGRPTGVRIVGDPKKALAGAEVVIDFSSPTATEGVVRAAAELGVACVVGTTGLSEGARAALDEAALKVPVVAAPNMSLGVQVLAHVLREALGLLGDEFDVEVIEAHHREKKDAPSGTALRLVQVALDTRGLTHDDVAHGRSGGDARRKPREVGVHAVRGGDIVGDHTVVLAGLGERIELTHKATSRAVFAAGALRAGRWVVGRPPGKYTMADVLGLAHLG
ncbi:MAG: 4-hydroxy-tetrahydrodipicolinate reductase [Myxococcales bacterium]|nr:4-hydroxy-tetrahydrodipicolinate reductase [Myxococcales bacterium]